MGTNECSQPASKSSWDFGKDFGDVSMVLKWSIFASPPGHNELMHSVLMTYQVSIRYCSEEVETSVPYNNCQPTINYRSSKCVLQ